MSRLLLKILTDPGASYGFCLQSIINLRIHTKIQDDTKCVFQLNEIRICTPGNTYFNRKKYVLRD